MSVDLGRGLSDPPADEAVVLASPFEAPATVLQGGGSPLISHHSIIQQQRYALDFILTTADGRDSHGDGTALEDHPCFGAPLLAPAAGVVVAAVTGRPDMPIG